MALKKVRVTWVGDMTLVCLEDLIDFYSGEYAELLAASSNGHGAEVMSSDTAKVLVFLQALQENFNGGNHGEEELESD